MTNDKIVLRDERQPGDRRSLWAYVDDKGDFVIDGQDLGTGVQSAVGPSFSEYEWMTTVAAADIPQLVAALGAAEGTPVLDAVRAWLPGKQTDDLERFIEERGIPIDRFVRIGD